MKSLEIGVVEDELVIARTIINTLGELGYSHCGPVINYTEAIQMIEENKPDLVLLDIQLAGKKDGIDVAQKLNELYDVPFIFLTANSDIETIDRAKKVKPYAYIVKPFTKEELYATIEIAFNNFNDKKLERKTGKFEEKPSKDFLFVKVGYVFKKIFLSELLFMESDANYVTLHLKSDKKVIARSTLSDFMEQVGQKIFVRVHRSYCVNINLIEDIFPTELRIQGMQIPIGKSYKEELFKSLGIDQV